MDRLVALRAELRAAATPEKAKASGWFFKTGPGEYGEGDQFVGVKVPEQRAIAKRFVNLPLADTKTLLTSKIHEERLIALIILVSQYNKADETTQKEIYDFYLSHTGYINNWDLVDSSAGYIVGAWLLNRDKAILAKLARSASIWERRIAMIATFYYIRLGDPTEAFKIADILLRDREDLIQKAVGWMLREIGKRCSHEVEAAFLQSRYKTMPRTALRYAIEHFPPELRAQYLKGEV